MKQKEDRARLSTKKPLLVDVFFLTLCVVRITFQAFKGQRKLHSFIHSKMLSATLFQ